MGRPVVRASLPVTALLFFSGLVPNCVAEGFVEEVVTADLLLPTTMDFAPDGRLFVAEQSGTIWVVKNGQRLPTPFLTLTVDSRNERGLIGMTFDLNFAQNRWVYVHYTATTPVLHNRVSRFTASGDVALPGSEHVVFESDPLSESTIHNGGTIQFGADGKLYIATGDNDVNEYAQSLNTVLGKILRINADGSIPLDNPFYATTTGKNRAIWALGLRNPFRFDIERGTGRMFVNDVGLFTWEEINPVTRGANFGWPTTEGPTTDPRFVAPLFAYRHPTEQNRDEATTGCSITAGAFYDPLLAQFPPSYAGKYFFADFCHNWIRVLDPATGVAQEFARLVRAPVEIRIGPDGALYYLSHGYRGSSERAGAVVRVRYEG